MPHVRQRAPETWAPGSRPHGHSFARPHSAWGRAAMGMAFPCCGVTTSFPCVLEFSAAFSLLLTGTPVQNSLQELYALLTLLEPAVFPREQAEEFVRRYQDVEREPQAASELHRLLRPFLLRRVKAEVASELPGKTEVVLYHGLSALQKRCYKAILMKDLDAFENEVAKKVKLQNILSQLRKCVNHPYLFDGVEPEPFEIGDHLIEASGKLHLLDKLLAFLRPRGHRVLLFSQMTQMLDILQDYMDYRGYSYERVDGSVRGEERHLAIKNFGQQPIFVFLLSTRAGGVGMNLTAADTVIFVDSDFNPQNDLQAAARAHRIGQNKSVKVIRLIGRDTVEEMVCGKAAAKLQLASTVVEGGHLTLGTQQPAAGLQLSEILKFGLDKLLSSEGSSVGEVDLESILGETEDGQWAADTPPAAEGGSAELEEAKNHMYLFEGKDYSKEPSKEDRRSFEQLVNLQKTLLEKTSGQGRLLRNKGRVPVPGLVGATAKRKRMLSPEELEDRRNKRQAAAAKRKQLMEEKRRRKEAAEHEKKLAWWASNHYRSFCLPSEDSEAEGGEHDGAPRLGHADSDVTSIEYVSGDVAHPQAGAEDAVIVHCVDDSGCWGRGGLFTALEKRSAEPRKIYELAGKMKDLSLGSVLLFPIDDKESRNEGRDLLALIVAQHRDRASVPSGIKMAALEEGLKKLSSAAKGREASVHLPRIGHATRGFNWYGTERLIRKHLAARGIPTYIYYFPRNKAAARPAGPSAAS
uniref:Chromodomain helicase DNA binding protein 1 like n=1 Tax=Rousettus aegyptiacus TaxID=9407 RepID=A0A7J8BD80_ROUAE|nr:chromodomain helicase DNA binding protein 1 like [Rousettus aegyptiacus]